MTTTVHVYTSRKGSNPGGKCLVRTPREEFDAYLKYCPASQLPKGSPEARVFTPAHQPIYEAVTLVLAQTVGLRVPQFHVLRNNAELQFDYEPGIRCDIRTSQPYYFVSRLMPIPPAEDSEQRRAALRTEKLYRDLLLVSDISEKSQNYRYDPADDSTVYLDLGCSFLDAVEGFISLSTYKIPTDTKPHRKLSQKLKQRLALETKGGQSLLLEQLVNVHGGLQVPTLNPEGNVYLSELLSTAEMALLSRKLQLNLLTIRQKYKSDERLLVIDRNLE